MAGAQTSEVDTTLQGWLSENPTVIGYVVMNNDGIPVKYHQRMPYDMAIKYSALLLDFTMKARKCLKELMGGDSELANLRIRTKEKTEVIVGTTVMASVEYILVVIQNCSGAPWQWPDQEGGGGGGEGA
mmetsp:Transcript_31877/g.73069  ORF Transcript_31877/g.73069 Transcript_31877/m.73069 type:complete len:129 (-) Transcript_31877:57-443(-)